jgi:hypothetical protein
MLKDFETIDLLNLVTFLPGGPIVAFFAAASG